jgi:hypothetical protein
MPSVPHSATGVVGDQVPSGWRPLEIIRFAQTVERGPAIPPDADGTGREQGGFVDVIVLDERRADCGLRGVDELGSDRFRFRERIPIGHLAANHIVHRTGPAIEEEKISQGIVGVDVLGRMKPANAPLPIEVEQQRFAPLLGIGMPAMRVEILGSHLVGDKRRAPRMLRLHDVLQELGNLVAIILDRVLQGIESQFEPGDIRHDHDIHIPGHPRRLPTSSSSQTS